MIITQKAEEKIKELLNKEEYLRVKIAGGGCSGYRIGLEKETNREVDDVMMMDKILLDPISGELLTKATLDWNNDAFTPTFHWDIPNTRSCGCGNSSTLEET